MKRRLKIVLGWLAYRTGLYRRFFRKKALVVLFHRVDDRIQGNPITCTGAEFRRFCEFFGKYFRVISLRELLDRLARGKDLGGHLVITFDDGYKDNLVVAAEVLSTLKLPACFFVATDLIGSQHVPWWDEKLPVRTEWMDWNDVRSLRARGFEIGSHTMNHVDLGEAAGEMAVKEIVGSKQRLEAELKEPCEFFSYPFGRVHQITEENRERVRQAGYECCVSAFGGAVEPGTNPFRIKRAPVSPWYLSPYQFGFEAIFFEP